jgi:hypothetical protein
VRRDRGSGCPVGWEGWALAAAGGGWPLARPMAAADGTCRGCGWPRPCSDARHTLLLLAAAEEKKGGAPAMPDMGMY